MSVAGKSIAAAVAAMAVVSWLYLRPLEPRPWTPEDVQILQSLWIGSLPALPDDPSNAVASDPRAAEFGHRLFFDPRMSANGFISCSTCHQPIRRFTDGLPKGQAIGTSKRNTPSIVGATYSPWLYWDGRRDSLWSQAVSPIEDPGEHGGNRKMVAELIMGDPSYRSRYESLFGAADESAAGIDEIFANVGKSIAAYERLLLPGPSRFDNYVEAVVRGDTAAQRAAMSDDEISGLQLFVGEASCTQCHNGPLFTNHEFHNTGVISFPGDVPDKGRVAGVREVMSDPFNCLGDLSDAVPQDCAELEFARTGAELIGAMRTPSLRNLENTAPYMHKGQLPSLTAVLEHYNEAPLAMIGHNEAEPLGLNRRQLGQLEAFLRTLAAPLATEDFWLAPPPTGLAGKHDEQEQNDQR